MEIEDVGVPIDQLWFRVSKTANDLEPFLVRINGEKRLVMLDRGEYYQSARSFARARSKRSRGAVEATSEENPSERQLPAIDHQRVPGDKTSII
jgi:hypothetical protein